MPEDLIRRVARRIATAGSACTYEDLGIQQAPNSTLSSYLNKLLWILTGNFAKPGGMFLHSTFAPIAGSGTPGGSSAGKVTPVTGARIIAGLMPCNSIADEILADHPDRFRALWLDSVNPAHSLADSKRFKEAMGALELSVVIDVAMTETARHADYVLPAASQYEKWEATFFNSEFPENTFHLRAPLLDSLPGTLSEPEIYARLIRAIGAVDETLLATLRDAAGKGRAAFAAVFFDTVAGDPRLLKLAPYLLYESLGETLPDGAAGTAALWAVAQVCALTHPDAVARAGFEGEGFEPGDQLFEAVLEGRGVVFTSDDYPDAWNYVRRPDRRFTIEIPELLSELAELADRPSAWVTEEFPFVLSAGERRSYTANTIIRDPSWRKRDPEGALRIASEDAAKLGVSTGGRVKITTEGGAAEAVVEVSEMMQPGHVSLPNGLGVDFSDATGAAVRPGVSLNDLTSVDHRDWLAGTPWHKHVPARVEAIA